ncbi:MAG: hypothetical protein AB1345_04695 [Chloroflexota bacterium]
MTALNIREMLLREVKRLPESLAEEVFDFVLFVKERHAEEAFLWQQVQETQSYRQKNPQDVISATAEEWDEATRHLE